MRGKSMPRKLPLAFYAWVRTIMPMIIVLLLLSYLLGGIPTGILLARAFRLQDPRTFASGNIGASNLTRLGGKRLGLLTLVGDAVKGILPLVGAFLLAPESRGLHSAVALFAVIGHCFPIYLGFRGGKGVATAAGVLLVLAPLEASIGVAAWIGVFFWKRITSLAALVSSALIPCVLAILRGPGAPETLAAATIGAVVIFRHQQNIRDLLAGRERSFSSGK